jgi:hypothetical protein
LAERPAARTHDLGYEPRDVSVRLVLLTVLAGLAFIALAGAALYGLQALYAGLDPTAPQPPPTALERHAAMPPPPRLQVKPAEDLAAYIERENRLLESYGWVDEDAGIARIPIERAMQLLAERGWPQPAEGPPPPPRPVTGRERTSR